MKKIDNIGEIDALFSPGNTIVMHSAFAEPAELGRQLVAKAGDLDGTRIFNLMPMGDTPYAEPEAVAHLDVTTFFPGARLRQAVNDGRVSLHATPLSAIPGLFERGRIKADFLFLQLSPPDANGMHSLGICVDYMQSVLAQNPVVAAEINPLMPFTCGHSIIPADQIDYYIEKQSPLAELPQATPDPVDEQIAADIAGLVEDGDVLQFGIGAIPDLTLSRLGHLRGLSVHSGLISPAITALFDAGALAETGRGQVTAPVVATIAGGNAAFYRFLDRNPKIAMEPSSYTHNHDVMASIDRLCAINSVLQIDLLGRANAERIGDKVISGPGGLSDFARGANASKGGRSIIALRAAARGGTASNILSRLPDGAPVSLTADYIDYVVTEYGVASFGGVSEDELASRLAAIAHPDFRDELRRS